MRIRRREGGDDDGELEETDERDVKEDENEAVQSRDFLDLHRQAPKIEGMASFWV